MIVPESIHAPQHDPSGVVYNVMVTDDEGRNPRLVHVFLNQSEANKFAGEDKRYSVVPVLTFATASAARHYSQGTARRRILQKLTEAEQVVLFGKVE